MLLVHLGIIHFGVLGDFGTENYTSRLDIIQKSLMNFISFSYLIFLAQNIVMLQQNFSKLFHENVLILLVSNINSGDIRIFLAQKIVHEDLI